MKKMISVFIILFMAFSFAHAEETSPYPFGIPTNASSDDVANILSEIFGEVFTTPGFEDKYWGISPDNTFLYDLKISGIQLYKKEDGWQLEFRLDEENPDLFADHLLEIYNVFKEQYGIPLTTKPEMYNYDIFGESSLRILFEEPGAIEKYLFDAGNESTSYFCDWDICSMFILVAHFSTSYGYKTSCSVSLSWYKEYRNATREEATPEAAP